MKIDKMNLTRMNRFRSDSSFSRCTFISDVSIIIIHFLRCSNFFFRSHFVLDSLLLVAVIVAILFRCFFFCKELINRIKIETSNNTKIKRILQSEWHAPNTSSEWETRKKVSKQDEIPEDEEEKRAKWMKENVDCYKSMFALMVNVECWKQWILFHEMYYFPNDR